MAERPFLTVRDLEGLPDDGNRYELIDGVLFVEPTGPRRPPASPDQIRDD